MLMTVFVVLSFAFASFKTWEAKSYFRKKPGDLLLKVSAIPPTGEAWNPGFELRIIGMRGGSDAAGPPESYDWSPGHPREIDLWISEHQCERIIHALARDGFFQEAGGASSREGVGFFLLVQGPFVTPPGSNNPLGARPEQYSISWDWDPPRIARRLRAIRKVLEGDAARAFDQMIRQIPSVPR